MPNSLGDYIIKLRSCQLSQHKVATFLNTEVILLCIDTELHGGLSSVLPPPCLPVGADNDGCDRRQLQNTS